MVQWNSCSQKPDVMSSIQGLRKLVKADSLSLFFFFGYKTSLCTQRFPGFRFLCFTSCCFPSILSMSTRLRVVQSHDMCLLVSYLRLSVCLR